MWASLLILFIAFMLIHPVADRARKKDWERGATEKEYPVPEISNRNKMATRI